MTQPDQGIGVDANDVIDELVSHIGRLAKENAILRAQVKTISTPRPQVVESETPAP